MQLLYWVQWAAYYIPLSASSSSPSLPKYELCDVFQPFTQTELKKSIKLWFVQSDNRWVEKMLALQPYSTQVKLSS